MAQRTQKHMHCMHADLSRRPPGRQHAQAHLPGACSPAGSTARRESSRGVRQLPARLRAPRLGTRVKQSVACLLPAGRPSRLQVRRWTMPKRLKASGQASDSILDCDRIILPVHQGLHWVCAVIDLQHRKFVYYDSLKVGPFG